MLLDNIKTPKEIKSFNINELETLCGELRTEIMQSVSVNGGHLASNLGDIELTVAIHKIFDLPDDKLIFDVGHQCYAHKLLTGRRIGFEKLRSDGGVSGFTKRSESEFDPFGSGHSGNALSAAVGISFAEKLNGTNNYTVALIGDGGFTNGMTYEALNNCACSDLKLIVVLNDNEMAISRNVGNINNVFTKLRVSKRYFRFKNRFVKIVSFVPFLGNGIVSVSRKIKDSVKRLIVKENFFETLGFEYIGAVDGNDIKKLLLVLEQAKKSKKPCIVHVKTKKGKGYDFAEKEPGFYHSVGRFDINKGIDINAKKDTFSCRTGQILCKEAEHNTKLCAVTAAMTAGTGLTEFSKKYSNRFFDVGIAEEHAVTFCTGLSTQGFSPVFVVYSTFLQRAFDQIIEDAAMQNLKLTLLIDRAGIIPDDGITHHGIFDVSMLNSVCGTVIYAPDSYEELEKCILLSLEYNGVSAVRYPKGCPIEYDRDLFVNKETYAVFDIGEPERVIITYGRLTSEAVKAAKKLGNTRVIRLIKLKPLDIEEINKEIGSMPTVFAEEGVFSGGIGEQLLFESGKNIKIKAIKDVFPEHGSLQTLYKQVGIDAESILREFEQ